MLYLIGFFSLRNTLFMKALFIAMKYIYTLLDCIWQYIWWKPTLLGHAVASYTQWYFHHPQTGSRQPLLS